MTFHKAGIASLARLSLLGFCVLTLSCKGHLIFDYEGNCEDEVEIYIKYDYNTARADMRAYHVGYAKVYAVDENGDIAAVQTVQGSSLRDKNYCMVFRGLQPGRYTFHAYAFQKPYEECAEGKGARFRAVFPESGQGIDGLSLTLDRDTSTVVAPTCGLDTLWVGRSMCPDGLVIPSEYEQSGLVHRDTISLVRDTKYIHLTLHQVGKEDRAEIFDTDFEVRIICSNGTIAWNNYLMDDEEIAYMPFAAWTTSLSRNGIAYDNEEQAGTAPEDDPIVERAAHFNICCSRLMYYATAGKGENARLQIIRKEDGETAVDINLPYYLSFGRDAYAVMNYDRQEYLDREYDYHMDFFLEDGKWTNLYLKINVMAWSKRFQNEIL